MNETDAIEAHVAREETEKCLIELYVASARLDVTRGTRYEDDAWNRLGHACHALEAALLRAHGQLG